MISLSMPVGVKPILPRRDLVAIMPYLNRKEFDLKPAWEQARQVEAGGPGSLTEILDADLETGAEIDPIEAEARARYANTTPTKLVQLGSL